MIFLPKNAQQNPIMRNYQTKPEIIILLKKKKEQPVVFKNALKGKERLNWVYFL